MCLVCKFLEKFQKTTRADTVVIRIAATSVKDLALSLHAIANQLEVDYPKLDGKDVLVVTDRSIGAIGYDHVPPEVIQQWRTNESKEHNEQFKTGFAFGVDKRNTTSH